MTVSAEPFELLSDDLLLRVAGGADPGYNPARFNPGPDDRNDL